MAHVLGRFSEAAMTEVMREVAARLGVPVEGARLVRLTVNATFALPHAGVVIRITRSHTLHDRAYKVARLGEWFAEVDAPTVQLVSSVDQPVHIGQVVATVWHYVPPAPRPTVADLGRVLRQFHGLGAPELRLPRWDPVGDARRRLADAEGLADLDREFLEGWCDRLAPRIDGLAERTGISWDGLMHGDAHAGNLLRDSGGGRSGGGGRVLLCDFDATCLGPWQVDLAAVPVAEVRFGRAGAHRELAAAYGYDVTGDASWPLLREARELKLVAAALPVLASRPGVAEEFAVRLRSVQRNDAQARWTPYANLDRED